MADVDPDQAHLDCKCHNPSLFSISVSILASSSSLPYFRPVVHIGAWKGGEEGKKGTSTASERKQGYLAGAGHINGAWYLGVLETLVGGLFTPEIGHSTLTASLHSMLSADHV